MPSSARIRSTRLRSRSTVPVDRSVSSLTACAIASSTRLSVRAPGLGADR
jgi:hypothetical protein